MGRSYYRDGPHVVTEVHTETQTAELRGGIPARHLRISLTDGSLDNDETDTETVTVEVVSGLQVVRGETPADVLSYDGTATLRVDGAEQTADLTDGSGSIDVTTSKSAGSIITVEAVGLADHPAGSDRAEIEVVNA